MIKKLSTAAILATTMLGGTVPFAYGMDPNEIREESKSTSSGSVVKIRMKKHEDGDWKVVNPSEIDTEKNPQGKAPLSIMEERPEDMIASPGQVIPEEKELLQLTNAQKMQAELLELQQKSAAIQAALLQEAQAEAAAKSKHQEEILAAIATQKEELAKQEAALKQLREGNAKQAALLEQQKREAEEERQRVAIEKEKSEAAAQVAATQQRMLEEERQRVAIEKERSEAAARLAAAQQKTLEEERQKAEAAAQQRREQQAKLDRDAQELLTAATKKFEAFTQDITGKLSRHNQRVEQKSANAKYAQYTGGRAVKNHILATTANDDPAQKLIKLAATDDNLYMTLMLKKDACPERTGDIGLANKLKAAKLEYIKQQQLSSATKK